MSMTDKKNGSIDGEFPGPVSFADFKSKRSPSPVNPIDQVRRVLSNQSHADSIIDEETIHWGVFFTRIFLILLLLLMIVCLGLYRLNPGFLFLAIFICGFLVICLVATFVDLSCIWKRCSCCKKETENQAPTDIEALPEAPTAVAANVETVVENPFGNYHNKL